MASTLCWSRQAALSFVTKLLALSFFLSGAAASLSDRNDQTLEQDGLKSRADKPSLRIMGLGASIMYGYRSTDGNGCRQSVRNGLRFQGFEVDMVGNNPNGTMVDNDVTAVPGYILTQIRDEMAASVGYQPNVVIINGGTNDADGNIDIPNAGSRMNDVLNVIWNTAGNENPNACVIVSTLLPTTNSNGIAYGDSINSQYKTLVSQLQGQGKCIYLADMRVIDPSTGNTWISVNNDIHSDDGIHPTDGGYQKMASIMYNGIMKAYNDGKIKDPSPLNFTDIKGCDKVNGNSLKISGLTQQGSGADDGIYYHDSQYMGVAVTIQSQFDRQQWFTAKLFSPNKDDILGWYNSTATSAMFGVWKNTGTTTTAGFTRVDDLNPDLYCTPDGITFIDMNSDGLDDMVCVDSSGNAYLSINQGDGTASKLPTFKRVSDSALIMTGKAAQSQIRIADIDGDGRGDYCVIDATNGNIHVYRNGWVDDIPQYWQDLGVRSTIDDMGDIAGIRFADITGGNGDDWLWVSDVGTTYTWTNARSCLRGADGNGLNVAWRQGFAKGQSSGPTHGGLASYQPAQGRSLRPAIKFAKVFGQPAAFGVRPKSDYVFFNHTKISDTQHQFDVLVWKNNGSGGSKLKIDGDKYCNMMGHKSGAMDYVWTWSTGNMTLYPNAGKTNLTGSESFWGAEVDNIWSPQSYVGKDLDRRDLHLIDWDGDGACDVVWTDPDNNNKVSVWLNKYPSTGAWQWTYLSNPSPELSCSQKRGKEFNDLPVRLADITGDGKADYLCIGKDGLVTGYVQSGTNSFTNVNQIKFAQGFDRTNLRWSDVNGDGKADMVHIDKFTGDASVLYNGGQVSDPGSNSGSSFHWDTATAAWTGAYAGTCQYFPDLDGNGRTDLHSITDVFQNTAETWLNPSCSLRDAQGDDPGGVVNPNLPSVPGSNGAIS